MKSFDLDTINFRLNFADFPQNKVSMGSGVIYTSNDEFAEEMGMFDGLPFLG